MLERALALHPERAARAAEGPGWDGDATLRFAGARMRIGGGVYEVDGYHRDYAQEWPVTVESIEIGIEAKAPDGTARTEWLASDLALTAASGRHPHSGWAIVSAGTRLDRDELTELIMIAYSGPPEADRIPGADEEAEHWAAGRAIATCAIGGPVALPEAVAGLTAPVLGRCLPVRLGGGDGVRIAVLASTAGTPMGSWGASGKWAEADDIAGARSGNAAANRKRYVGTAFERHRALEIGMPLDGAERVRALQTEAAGDCIEQLGSELRGRMRRPEPGGAHGTIVWRAGEGGDAAIAAHRISSDEAAAIVELMNAGTIRMLDERAREPHERRGPSAAIREAGLG